MFGIIGMIVVGLISGAVARWIFPGEQKMGWLPTIGLGIGGSFLAGFLGKALGFYGAGQGAGLIGSVIGALVLLFAWNRLSQSKSAPPSQ